MLKSNLIKYRTDIGYTQEDVAKKLNVKRQTYSAYERGVSIPDADTLSLLADLFNVSSDMLLGRDDKKAEESTSDNLMYDNIFPIAKKKFPLLGEIACGKPIFADERHESYVMSGTDIDADFCLRAKGDSMIGARIMDGDIVFIRKQPMVDNGQIAAVVIDDEATLKRVYYEESKKLVLAAENPKYPPIVYIGEELNSVRILGLAIAFQSDIR